MTNPRQQTTGVDVDALPEQTVAPSTAPAGTGGSAMPTVGTNAESQWAMWDPNMWWTDWSLPADPRPSWELWFDWVNQLKALTLALTAASQDWQTMIDQFDQSLQTVRGMRGDLTDWTGPSAKTTSDSMDRLENSITSKTASIRDNPAKLNDLARTINDAVGPMTSLDAEYQQVLNDLTACRQVAERGKPIMLNLATKLLQTGTDLENSVRTDNLAPQPVQPQALTLTDGPQGPTQQLAQVAGPSGVADPGTVTAGAQVPVAVQPSAAGASASTDPGQVVSGAQVGASSLPGVAVGPDQSGSGQGASLAGMSAGGAAPTLPAPAAAAPAAPVAPTLAGGAMPVTPFVASGVMPVAASVRSTTGTKEDKEPTAVVVPVVAAGVVVSGSTAVPAALRGRTGEQDRTER